MPRGDFPSSKQDQYMLRFPDGMRDRLKAAAEHKKRSLNAEIVFRLEQSFFWDELSEITHRAFERGDPPPTLPPPFGPPVAEHTEDAEGSGDSGEFDLPPGMTVDDLSKLMSQAFEQAQTDAMKRLKAEVIRRGGGYRTFEYQNADEKDDDK